MNQSNHVDWAAFPDGLPRTELVGSFRLPTRKLLSGPFTALGYVVSEKITRPQRC
jgi:hypothetical protein